MRVVIPAVFVVIVATAWVVLSARAWRGDPSWSPKRDLIILGMSAAVTIFVALPIAAPGHHEAGQSVARRVALWAAVWLAVASLIRLLALLRERLVRR